uniref:Diamine acetyltransferase 1 n=1 Tax=Petromyzon marinus TaxID=7757 RepID=A0AAJ7XJG8_PETMA|nr:diamine acetyltransferase 1-like [Petromyzon marinus]
MENFNIRRACADDCKGILRMIKELATYEKLGDDVHLTEQELRQDGFGDRVFYQCLVAELKSPPTDVEGSACSPPGDSLVGFAMFYFVYDPWTGKSICLEDFYVMKEYRGQGIGSEILKLVSQVAVESRCSVMTFLVAEWNAPSIGFYRRRGAVNCTESEGWHVYNIPQQSLRQIASGECVAGTE